MQTRISDLPDACLGHVLGFLSEGPSRAAARLTCRHWCSLSLAVPQWWRQLRLSTDASTLSAPRALEELCRFLRSRASLLHSLSVLAEFQQERLLQILGSAEDSALKELQVAARMLGPAECKAIGCLRSLAGLVVEPPRELGGVLARATDLAALSSLTGLHSLKLECTFVEPGTLPAGLTSLQHLTSLELIMHRDWQHASILVLPAAAFRSWTQLRWLALTNARVRLEPEDVAAGWRQLEELALRDCVVEGQALSALPSLGALTRVDLFAGSLVDTPAAVVQSVAECAPLQSLRLAQSNLEELPPLTPGQLSALTTLAIEWAGLLASFPPSWCLPSLQVLSLQCCPHLAGSTWPAAMTSMTGLRTLHLCTLRLVELPEPVVGLSGLTCLELANNRLQSLPDGPYLEGLQLLGLQANRFPRVPLALAAATQLRYLDLSFNFELSLRPAGRDVLLSLPSLQELDVAGLALEGNFVAVEELARELGQRVRIVGPEA